MVCCPFSKSTKEYYQLTLIHLPFAEVKEIEIPSKQESDCFETGKTPETRKVELQIYGLHEKEEKEKL